MLACCRKVAAARGAADLHGLLLPLHSVATRHHATACGCLVPQVLNEIRAGRATPFQGIYSWCEPLPQQQQFVSMCPEFWQALHAALSCRAQELGPSSAPRGAGAGAAAELLNLAGPSAEPALPAKPAGCWPRWGATWM